MTKYEKRDTFLAKILMKKLLSEGQRAWMTGFMATCIIRPVSSLTVLRLLPALFWGGHVSHPAVSMHQTRTLRIETDTPMLLYADGEPMCETPATIEIIKEGLSVMAP